MNIAPDNIHVMKKSEMPKITRYTIGQEDAVNVPAAEEAANEL